MGINKPGWKQVLELKKNITVATSQWPFSSRCVSETNMHIHFPSRKDMHFLENPE
ncbi:unnamed protein product [Dovyalis caffra]|uniref:Uncharacterized protein n=1 Tax=Dovyalis caffra TaxID=77055 RepID=A0AAV1RVD8_9ROSI|nr:unnamed protein product [Dovyalis caffra]